MWEFGALLLLLAVLAVFLAPRFLRSGPGAGAQDGTVLVTGVSPRPEATGAQYVTITGVLHGPTVDEHEVYQRYAVDVSKWPSVGDLLPVRYSPRNPDNWNLTGPIGD
ncbi:MULTISPECIES: hypothetical protein [Mycolicibacter]|uniref:DUF3592 domain-containing protein n=1 Tax=Mycolicibacter virginiensis TaxID=1795032 RepID=A0A9X7NZT8_9MYCO|nr:MULTISPECIES: hypothetical protein [Mycobacteriaceae]OBG40574.1 hypothetical protein A5671_01395 [Mycolicibacter heraklionensis]OBJ33351.1 hypothetical protein A5631_06000 [Mycolicibacter heraklionensis]PQM53454.1 hypothetical protein C5U48_04725 [Mycolicibacter virginiensis]ULP46374.1 hypothetical protein MJO54_16275 [Mycolicibacter virginiensis]